MAAFDSPLRVPKKRAKKHPDAPKSASSAFLFFMRPRIQAEHLGMKNTEVSKKLGEAWGEATEEQKAPLAEKEKIGRALQA
jgi:hypothetical protein